MKNEQVVLNFLVYADCVKKGALQSELLEEIASLGFKSVEIRREYFKNRQEEIPVIKAEASRLNLTLFYSVPDEVYVKGELNPKLGDYLLEASAMGVKHIKWNIGEFTGDLHKEEMKALLGKGIEISVENDQTLRSGKIAAITRFMEAVKEGDLGIGYVYDLGNWRFVGEDERVAAELLKEYVSYIHLKDVIYVDTKPQAVGLDQGEIPWREIVSLLPQDVPVAIEYPTSSQVEIIEAKELLEHN